MSLLLSNNLVVGIALFKENESRLQPIHYRPLPMWVGEDARWPRSNFRSAGLTAAEAPLNSAPLMWDWLWWTEIDADMGQRRNIVTGTTIAANGAVLASCIVKLYETASDAVMDTGVTSNASGVYVTTSPNSTACYAVAYKAGSPDVEGTTVNTLIPA